VLPPSNPQMGRPAVRKPGELPFAELITTPPKADPITKEVIARANEAESDADDFDWNDPNEEAIVLREQRATAVYRNSGEVVIRQRGWPDDDTVLFISRENEVAFMEGMAAQLRK
jgi:hypothetical protein